MLNNRYPIIRLQPPLSLHHCLQTGDLYLILRYLGESLNRNYFISTETGFTIDEQLYKADVADLIARYELNFGYCKPQDDSAFATVTCGDGAEQFTDNDFFLSVMKFYLLTYADLEALYPVHNAMCKI